VKEDWLFSANNCCYLTQNETDVGVHGVPVGRPGPMAPVATRDGVAENAEKAAKTMSVKMDERSNAFMGRSPVFFTLGCLGGCVRKRAMSIHIAERFPMFFSYRSVFGNCKIKR
jgi:hypothetical protein